MLTWSTETFAQNPNANAIRFGTMYNFRFDSNRPPQTANATIGFFKTGERHHGRDPGTWPDGGVTADPDAGCRPKPGAVSDGRRQGARSRQRHPLADSDPDPNAKPGTAQALNLSTRMLVGTGNNVGIGGFIITGTAPKQVLLRGIGPS